jgi:predicted adenylyl cyclase CyaB
MKNIELKARDRTLADDVRTCRRIGAQFQEVLRQRDTYFRVKAGRLKLREFGPGRAELIAYQRPNTPRARVCEYVVQPVDDPAPLRRLLGACLGTLAEVRKTRRLYLWKGVRIHLDDVRDLGRFLEFEAVLGTGGASPARGRARVEFLRNAFNVRVHDIVRGSYLDLEVKRSV